MSDDVFSRGRRGLESHSGGLGRLGVAQELIGSFENQSVSQDVVHVLHQLDA